MAYAQINYNEKVGSSNLTIAAIGCFITAGCNLLADIGVNVDPETLNIFYTNTGAYIYDRTDRANDDLTWGSVTRYNPYLKLVQVGGGGWPNSNLAIVEFSYISPHSHQRITHFCKIADHNAHTIVDSYDGKIKNTSIYGDPIAYAVYEYSPPQPPAPAPTPLPTAPFTIQAITPKEVQLNKSPTHKWNLDDTTWTSFSTNPATADPEGSIVTAVAIAHHKLGGSYYLTNTADHAGYNIVDCNDYTPPAPTPAPENVVPAPAPPQPSEPPKPSNTVYTRLTEALNLVTNKQPTHKWDLGFVDDVHATSVQDIPEGTAFIAVGKAQRTDNDKPCYYMTNEDFGNADTTGVPTNNHGVNTVDLGTPSPHTVGATLPDGSEKINVTVKPSSWQSSYTAFLSPQDFIANASALVTNIDEESTDPAFPKQQQLLKGQTLKIAGTFARDGVKYYRTVNSVAANVWYGIPVVSLSKLGEEPDESDWDKVLDEIQKDSADIMKHEKTIAAAASANGLLQRFLHRNKK